MSVNMCKAILIVQGVFIFFIILMLTELLIPSIEYKESSVIFVDDKPILESRRSRLMLLVKEEDGSTSSSSIGDPSVLFSIKPGCKVMVVREYGWLTGFTYKRSAINIAQSHPTDSK